MSFATWISPEFQLYIMKAYRRLKTDENSRLSLNWNLNREISKLNYRIHTDAIKDNLIPSELTLAQVAYTYANEIEGVEKKEFLNSFVEQVDIYEQEQPDGKFLKHIKFHFPVYFGDRETQELCWVNESTVETVVLLGRKKERWS